MHEPNAGTLERSAQAMRGPSDPKNGKENDGKWIGKHWKAFLSQVALHDLYKSSDRGKGTEISKKKKRHCQWVLTAAAA